MNPYSPDALAPTEAHVNDPDAKGLPPYVVLPDAAEFRKGQWQARLVVNLVALGVLAAFLALSPEHRLVIGICAALVGVVAGVSLVQFLKASAAVKGDRATT